MDTNERESEFAAARLRAEFVVCNSEQRLRLFDKPLGGFNVVGRLALWAPKVGLGTQTLNFIGKLGGLPEGSNTFRNLGFIIR